MGEREAGKTDGEEEDKDSVDHSADDRDRCPRG